MFQDISISKTIIDQYKTFCENQNLIHIGMKNLKNNSTFDFLRYSRFFCSGT